MDDGFAKFSIHRYVRFVPNADALLTSDSLIVRSGYLYGGLVVIVELNLDSLIVTTGTNIYTCIVVITILPLDCLIPTTVYSGIGLIVITFLVLTPVLIRQFIEAGFEIITGSTLGHTMAVSIACL